MKKELCFSLHEDCRVCTERTDRGFRYHETKEGETFVFDAIDTYTIVFILSGSALVSCNEFSCVKFQAGEIVLWPMKSNCMWQSLTDTACIVFLGNNEMNFCDRKAISDYAHNWLTSVVNFKGLPIRPRLLEYLHSVKNYLDDGITCPYMHKAKELELSTIFRAYYEPEELLNFFFPTVCTSHEFELFVMNNYLKMKGVKEFVDLSGMNLSTFNRRFKAHFKESPYQWIIKQKSKHIYYALVATDRSFTSIAKEFHFTDASHFNRYCKTMFGDSPSKIRERVLLKGK